ncbi:kinase-like domain-containing protein [Lasiosphaeria miniovina]|uniref:non-specific serine/threonine protein kinase n=1 Tax=Lasiosphaeria miniovina TaxID=1954250 RepID=A0AA40DZS0_9PEZI|nr:kinase-like domain-containing protein [Lasiosphaeria miniovina]KAK0722599.1 kinase-like domain-containing protein [Lasiosphaeria miniovina]
MTIRLKTIELNLGFPKKRVVVHLYDGPDAPPSSPRRLEYWKSEKQPIGYGSQGRVFLQKCISGSRLYTQRAVKMIPLQEGNGRRRYVRELQIVIKFSHDRYSRYFVKSLGWYLSDDSLCIAMEYLAKGDLETYLQGSPPLPEDECRHVISQVTKGLKLMHKEGFAHRDIKPQNVLIQQSPIHDGSLAWWVRLTDFGISKPLEAGTNTAVGVGTLGYMAPELLGWGLPESSANISYPAVDMWALGVMSFRILMGTNLFPTPVSIFQYCGHPELHLPQSRLEDRNISPDGAAFIRALLRPLVAQRLESNAALLHDWIRPHTSSAPAILATHSGSSNQSSRNNRPGYPANLTPY